jgi:hypothetical protein
MTLAISVPFKTLRRETGAISLIATTLGAKCAAIFDGIARPDELAVGGLLHARGANKRTLAVAASTAGGKTVEDVGYYELDEAMKLRRVEDSQTHQWVKKNLAIPRGVLVADAASVLYVDDGHRRWRLPRLG